MDLCIPLIKILTKSAKESYRFYVVESYRFYVVESYRFSKVTVFREEVTVFYDKVFVYFRNLPFWTFVKNTR